MSPNAAQRPVTRQADRQPRTRTAPAVLIGQRPGAGRATAARLGGDPRVFVSKPLQVAFATRSMADRRYEDYVPKADPSPSAPRAMWERQLACAAWHAPTAVLLDNIDTVVGAEVKVRLPSCFGPR